MSHIRLPAVILRLLAPVLRAWWRIRRPTSFGVKVLLTAPDGRFLVVRHSYSEPNWWGLPGGGYKPNRETATVAAAREVAEELGLRIDPETCAELDTLVTTLEGKRDTLTILTAPATTYEVSLSPELAEARWITDLDDLGDAPRSRWLLAALTNGHNRHEP